jgi:hypothetical protein
VTKALTQCLDWYQADIKDHINTGSIIDRSNADKTLSAICELNGNIQGLYTAGQYEEVLVRYDLIEEAKDAKTD